MHTSVSVRHYHYTIAQIQVMPFTCEFGCQNVALYSPDGKAAYVQLHESDDKADMTGYIPIIGDMLIPSAVFHSLSAVISPNINDARAFKDVNFELGGFKAVPYWHKVVQRPKPTTMMAPESPNNGNGSDLSNDDALVPTSNVTLTKRRGTPAGLAITNNDGQTYFLRDSRYIIMLFQVVPMHLSQLEKVLELNPDITTTKSVGNSDVYISWGDYTVRVPTYDDWAGVRGNEGTASASIIERSSGLFLNFNKGDENTYAIQNCPPTHQGFKLHFADEYGNALLIGLGVNHHGMKCPSNIVMSPNDFYIMYSILSIFYVFADASIGHLPPYHYTRDITM
jgi:hypothetical protein